MKSMRAISMTVLLFICMATAVAQPITKRYIMAFHACGTEPCGDPRNHVVKLAESDDGGNWTLVPNFPAFPGSVPDVIIRGSKLYIFTPGSTMRYDIAARRWEGAMSVLVHDSSGAPGRFVDPSAAINSDGRLVLFFLNSTSVPIGQDPAGCGSYPCTKYFDSAIELPGSDGTEFILQPGHRVALSIGGGAAADPDIFTDGKGYVLYIARTGVMAFRRFAAWILPAHRSC